MSDRSETEPRGFRPIGSLAPRVFPSPSPNLETSSASSGKSSDSATTGNKPPAGLLPNLTGRPHGGTGAVKLPTIAGKAYLAVESSLAASLPLQSIVQNGVTLGWQVGFSLKAGTTRADMQASLALLTRSLLGASEAMAEQEVARLSITTKQRSPDSADLLLAEYTRRLTKYPADVVADVMRLWPDEHVFFPAWSELREELEWRIEKRVAMKTWIEDELAGKHMLHRNKKGCL